MTVFCILWLIKMKMLLIIYFVKWLAEEWLLASFLGKAMLEEHHQLLHNQPSNLVEWSVQGQPLEQHTPDLL